MEFDFWDGVSRMSECELFYIEFDCTCPETQEFMSKLKKQLEYFTELFEATHPLDAKMLQDNIKLIDKLGGKVYILPVRMLTEREDDVIHEVATKAFLSVFKEEMSFEEYTKNFKSIDDIIPALNTTAKQMLIFDASGDSLNTLEERFAYYKNNNDLPLPAAVSDATIFWFSACRLFLCLLDSNGPGHTLWMLRIHSPRGGS